MTVTNENNCTATATTTVDYLLNQVYIPNVFTPNNDAKNDYFWVYGNTDVARVAKMSVYDRDNKLLFYTENKAINDEPSGWDGLFNGQKILPGVFVYFIEIEFANGKKEVFKGDVTLIR